MEKEELLTIEKRTSEVLDRAKADHFRYSPYPVTSLDTDIPALIKEVRKCWSEKERLQAMLPRVCYTCRHYGKLIMGVGCTKYGDYTGYHDVCWHDCLADWEPCV